MLLKRSTFSFLNNTRIVILSHTITHFQIYSFAEGGKQIDKPSAATIQWGSVSKVQSALFFSCFFGGKQHYQVLGRLNQHVSSLFF